MDTFEVRLSFADSTRIVVGSTLPERWNWPHAMPLPRAGDDVVIAAAALGAQELRVAVRRIEFIVIPEAEALSNLFEAMAATSAVQVQVCLHLAIASSVAGGAAG